MKYEKWPPAHMWFLNIPDDKLQINLALNGLTTILCLLAHSEFEDSLKTPKLGLALTVDDVKHFTSSIDNNFWHYQAGWLGPRVSVSGGTAC